MRVLEVVQEVNGGFRLLLKTLEAGANYYQATGEDISKESFEETRASDAILLGAMGLPNIRYPDGTEIAPHLRMRKEFGLFAGVRPVKSYPKLPNTLADSRSEDIDIVILRESTEGLFAHANSGVVEDDRIARDVLEITRPNCERFFDFAFQLAMQRKSEGGPGVVTCVDKANVFRSMAFFRQVFDERAERYPEISTEYRYVDAMALDLVRQPWKYDVLVMEKYVWRYLVGFRRRDHRGVGPGPMWRDRNTPRFVSAGPRFCARYCWDRRCESDCDADLSCHDAGVARTKAPGQRLYKRRAENSKCGALGIQGRGDQAIRIRGK